MGKAKERHHFLSRFYLEGFVDSRNPPYLWIYDKERRTISKASATDAGCRRLFYAFPRKDGTTDTNSLEDIFQDLESQVAPLFQKIQSHQELTNEERSAVSYFLGLTLAKVPNFRSIVEANHARMIKEMGIRMAEAGAFEHVFILEVFNLWLKCS